MTSAGPVVLEAEVLERLRDVVDPCSLSMGGRRDIDDMGLIERVAIDGGSVRVELVLTDPGCVFWQGIRQNVVDVVSDLPGVEHVEVAVSPTATWSPSRMRRAVDRLAS